MKAFKLPEIKNIIKQVLLYDCNIKQSTIRKIISKMKLLTISQTLIYFKLILQFNTYKNIDVYFFSIFIKCTKNS